MSSKELFFTSPGLNFMLGILLTNLKESYF